MIQPTKKSIEAVVVIRKSDFDESVKPFWEVLQVDSYFTNIRLYSETSFEEVGAIMFECCSPIDDEVDIQNAKDALKHFIDDEGFVLSGGLIFKENGEEKFGPSCCCDLEDWNQWLDVPNGKTNIWNGHDPFCAVEIDGGKIKIWYDNQLKNESPSIEFSVEEFVEKMSQVEKDLKDFLVRLSQWAKQIEPDFEKQVVRYFAKNMNIKIDS